MTLSGLLPLLTDHPLFHRLADSLQKGSENAAGVLRAARPILAAALAQNTVRPVVIITARSEHAHHFAEQLAVWSPSLNVLTFAEPEPLFFQNAAWSTRTIHQRMQVLAKLNAGNLANVVIIASARAVMQRTIPSDLLADRTLRITRSQRLPDGQIDSFLHHLADIGYARASVVTMPGTFSHRGGIIDVYPITEDNPVRIELWGDEVDTLRTFDAASQLSHEQITGVTILPAREALPAYGPQAEKAISAWFDRQAHPAPDDLPLPFDPAIQRDYLASGQLFPEIEFYLPYFYSSPAGLLSYLPPDALVLLDDLNEIADTLAEYETQAIEQRDHGLRTGEVPPDMPLPYQTWDHLRDEITRVNSLHLVHRHNEDDAFSQVFSPNPRFGGHLKEFFNHLSDLLEGDSSDITDFPRIVIVSRQASRLAELWYEHARGLRQVSIDMLDQTPEVGTLTFVQGSLSEGWILRDANTVTHVLTDAEIFGWQRPEPRRRAQRRAVSPEDFFADLSPGDFVVHTEYGIGRFSGLEKRILGETEREFLLLTYAGGDTLYVPIYQADRLTRYVGVNDAPPDLSRLGTGDWSRTRERTRQAVEATAHELLELYAARETVIGHAFGPDTAWQHELEASFPFIETEDQLRALAEVKADMESPRPMDRLICGDVGYGKTEVALRATFKAVMGGKQVAILVPTTVLAQQHFDTFSRRLAPFPVQVEMLSRFRSPAEQDQIIAGLAGGQIDVVIGTHRLLGQDVIMHDLGLLIIDEEQRFGVTHKERLKKLRTEVDVLTMTATPIPRTLYMSLTGVRDISMIQTPPEERLPVVTYVGRRDDNLIRQAILREIDREGQVFYVHNRVETIYAEAEKLAGLVPEATSGIGHGQMNEHELESVMHQFAAGDIDILISTSIIEAGLDIPNANTLIVDRADLFGLSQLYQLRGRVGRSALRAYAYFLHPALNTLTDDARARLETIAEQTDLGAGLNIAMRDLEIRGAGDILGTRQHGQIAAVGFHLYTRMLSQAVALLRRERSLPVESDPSLREPITIDLPIPTFIPTDYIPDTALRIQLYRRLADLHSRSDIHALGVELADRFGPLPAEVENLLFQLNIKRLGLAAQVGAITLENGQIMIKLGGLAHRDRSTLQRSLGHNVRVSRTGIWVPLHDSWRSALEAVLDRLSQS